MLFEVRQPLRCALRYLLQVFVPNALTMGGLSLKTGQFEGRNGETQAQLIEESDQWLAHPQGFTLGFSL